MSKPENAILEADPASDTTGAQAGSTSGGTDPMQIVERVARLRGGMAGAHASIQAELMKERAASYGRAVAKVEEAYRALASTEASLDIPDPASFAERRARYEAAHASALRARWELLVHREAAGLYRTEDIDRDFPVPTRRP